ncbi:hypothetical protein [Streptomyces sp. NPDC055189]
MAAVTLAGWGGLLVLLVAPSLLPVAWHYYIYSPASVGLWLLSMFLSPFVACAMKWDWIRKGGGRRT